jgi:quaternary ammonium compound-resistance protein SugE
MKKALYTFLVWDFLLFIFGLSDITFYRNLISADSTMISWTQPALVSITSFLILLSIYYGLYQLLFGERFYMKAEMKSEDIDNFRSQTLNFLKKEKIDPDKLKRHLQLLIAAEIILWGIFIIYLFVFGSIGH